MSEFIEQEVSLVKNTPSLRVGDLVEVRPWRELQSEDSRGLIDGGWSLTMKALSGKRFVITQEMYDKSVRDGHDSFFEFDGYYLSASMLKIVNENGVAELAGKRIFCNDKQDPDIIAEMIKKVDRMRFKKLLCVASCDKSITVKTISDDIVDKYLTTWAKAKYDLYLLLNKNLSLSKQIETSIDNDVLRNRIHDLQFDFPQYANLLDGFSILEFAHNRCDGSNSVLRNFYDGYTNKGKLSKVLSGLVDDKSFTDALAMLLGGTTVKAVITISIDPFDYMTTSVNNYGWTTCQRIGDIDASYGTGAGSIMLDDNTVIAFAHTGKEVMYRLNGVEFSGNSKFWRQCVYIDKKSGNFIASREYPEQKEALAKEVRIFMENTIAEYLNVDNIWVVAPRGIVNYNEGSQNLYHDVVNEFPYNLVYIKNFDNSTSVTVGRNVFCLKCGKPIKGHSGRYTCCSPYDFKDGEVEADIPF